MSPIFLKMSTNVLAISFAVPVFSSATLIFQNEKDFKKKKRAEKEITPVQMQLR